MAIWSHSQMVWQFGTIQRPNPVIQVLPHSTKLQSNPDPHHLKIMNREWWHCSILNFYRNQFLRKQWFSLFLIENVIQWYELNKHLARNPCGKQEGLLLKNVPEHFILEIKTCIHPESNTSLNDINI
jgi:hypothetical protein